MATSAQHSNVRITSEQGLGEPGKVVPARKDRRARSRIQCEGLSCTLGRVIGLSGSGMRVRARGWRRYRQDDRLSLTLSHCGGQLTLVARVAWVRRTGLFRFESGMEFENLTPEQNAMLARLAQMSMPRTTMRHGIVADLPTE